jgi:fatty acid desaturase
MQYLGGTQLYTRSHYARELHGLLPPEASKPAISRLALVPMWLAIDAAVILAVATGWLPWFLWPVAAVVLGISYSGLTFVAHEALHGGIVRGRTIPQVIGFLGFLPFLVSPQLWTAWHNRAHHAHTNVPEDPDAYPTLEEYRSHAGARFAVDAFSLGGRRWRGVLSLILGFTVQSAHQLITAGKHKMLTPRQHRRAIVEAALAFAVWATLAAVVGFVPFLFVFVAPLLIANACVMMFILTNHSLSPRTAINDPLVSGLSVTTSRLLDRITIGFGYHVEHHLFPAMSTRHAPAVRALVMQKWPERYKSMPLVAALRALHRTGRVYKDDVTLCDPRTGGEFPTLMPGTPILATDEPSPLRALAAAAAVVP